jgi:hypothetical protein
LFVFYCRKKSIDTQSKKKQKIMDKTRRENDTREGRGLYAQGGGGGGNITRSLIGF